jgi:hypothetical protein
MKIRLMGASDLVRGWAAELQSQYSIQPRFYSMRGDENGLRAYLDMDDRTAAEILGRQASLEDEKRRLKRLHPV